MIALFACFYAAAVAIPIPWLMGRQKVQRAIAVGRDAQPRAAITLSNIRCDHELQALRANPNLAIEWIYLNGDTNENTHTSMLSVSSDQLALLQYTSGSTGSPKGVMLSHANLMANNEMIATVFGHDETLRGVTWLPLFHDMGLIGHVLQPVYVGGLSVLMSPLAFLQRPVRWLEAISAWKATTSGGPTYAYDLCHRTVKDSHLTGIDLSCWKVAYCGSEKVRFEVLQKFQRRFKHYGFRHTSLLPAADGSSSALKTGCARCTVLQGVHFTV